MPETAALVTALILERPMCLQCIARKANATIDEVERSFLRIGRVLTLQRHAADRCRACGAIGLVFSLEQPTGL